MSDELREAVIDAMASTSFINWDGSTNFDVLADAAIATVRRFDTEHAGGPKGICTVCGVEYSVKIKPGRHVWNFCPEHKIDGERARKRRWAQKQAALRKQSSDVTT